MPRCRIPLYHVVLPAQACRWTPRRKVLVLSAIQSGQISLADAMSTYGLSEEEILSWSQRHEQGGHRHLRATYRDPIHSRARETAR